jgi:hypothetical protein
MRIGFGVSYSKRNTQGDAFRTFDGLRFISTVDYGL